MTLTLYLLFGLCGAAFLIAARLSLVGATAYWRTGGRTYQFAAIGFAFLGIETVVDLASFFSIYLHPVGVENVEAVCNVIGLGFLFLSTRVSTNRAPDR